MTTEVTSESSVSGGSPSTSGSDYVSMFCYLL